MSIARHQEGELLFTDERRLGTIRTELGGEGGAKVFESESDCSHIRSSMVWIIVWVDGHEGDINDVMALYLIFFLFLDVTKKQLTIQMQLSQTWLLLSSPPQLYMRLRSAKDSDFLPTAVCMSAGVILFSCSCITGLGTETCG